MLEEFEKQFQQQLDATKKETREQAGSLLALIPTRSEWDRFIGATRQSWEDWRAHPDSFPACLMVLYGGLAFFEYEDASFWPKFAEAVGCPQKTIPLGPYNKLNKAYCSAIRRWGMKLIGTEDRLSYVGSAVHHIGIPLSLWDGFLDICEWAAVRDEWKGLPQSDWESTITRLSGSRRRLRSFLLNNREATIGIISEMLDARRCLSSDANLTIDQLKHACLLRAEYFDEVPETAEFLKPEDPESLFKDRPRLVWNDQTSGVVIHLPGLERDKLPATWQIGNREYAATATPNEVRLDSQAFSEGISMKLQAGDEVQALRLAGARPWGLFDMERGGYFVNPTREQLPLRSYLLVAPQKVEIKRDGFEESDCPANDPYELADRSQCFVTRLWPKDRFASLTVLHNGRPTTLRFRTRKRIEARLFVGTSWHAARFRREGDVLNIERLPIVCVLVPLGYFPTNEKTVEADFNVVIDGRRAGGSWESRGEALEDYELFYWKWSKTPFLDKVKSGKATSLQQLKDFYRPPDLHGRRTLLIDAPRLGIRFSYDLCFEHSRIEIEHCWSNLPGKYLLWFLLAQSRNGLKWDELALAGFVIARDTKASYFLLKKYADARLIVQRGRFWTIAESRASLTPQDGSLTMKYCGDPSILWGLYRKMYHFMKDKLPVMSVMDQRGELPHIEIKWPQEAKGELSRFLSAKTVRLVRDIWTP